MTLITKALCIPAGAPTVSVLLLAIQRSERYQISRSLLLRLLIFTIYIQRNFNCREGGVIGQLGANSIVDYLMEGYFWIGVSGTAMTVLFGLGWGLTTVNRMAVTALHRIVTHSFVSLYIFDVWLLHRNDKFLVIEGMIWVKTSPLPCLVKTIKVDFYFTLNSCISITIHSCITSVTIIYSS